MIGPERLRRRRCLGLRIAVVFALVLGVYYRGDWAVVGVVAAGALVALVAYWRDCRGRDTQAARKDAHTSDLPR